MWILLLACAIGQTDPAAPGSPSARSAEQAQLIADKAGQIAGLADELEQRSDPARERVAEGADPTEHMKKMRAKMAQIELLEAELQAEVQTFESGLQAAER